MLEHKTPTDQIKKIELPSSIQQVLWTRPNAAVGAKVGLEVFTQFVGNNSEIKIEISDKSGKVFETIKAKISGNKFWKQITVPEKAKDELYAEVKLPKHGLNKKSNCLYVYPQVQIKNLKWDKKEAREEDIVRLTADVFNAYEGTEAEIQIWEYDADGAHDFITKFPAIVKNKKIDVEWEYEYHEDKDEIPTQEELDKYGNKYNPPEYFFTVTIASVTAGQKQESGLLTFRDWIQIKLTNGLKEPILKEQYILYMPDGSILDGETDDKGMVLLEKVPPGKIFVEFPELLELHEVHDGEYILSQITETQQTTKDNLSTDTNKEEEISDQTNEEVIDKETSKYEDEFEDEFNEDIEDIENENLDETDRDEIVNLDEDPMDLGWDLEEGDEVIVGDESPLEGEVKDQFQVACLHCVTGREYHLALMQYLSIMFQDEMGYPITEPLEIQVKDDKGEIIFQGSTDKRGGVEHGGIGMGIYQLLVNSETIQISSMPNLSEREIIVLQKY